MDGRVRPRGHCDPRANGRPHRHPDRLHPSAEEPDEGDQGCRLPGRLGRLQRHHSNPGQSTGDRGAAGRSRETRFRLRSRPSAPLVPRETRAKFLHEKRWIDDASWREWATWIEVMCRNPIFTHVHTISRGMFNASFQEYLTGLMASSSVADGARSRAPKS